MFPQIGPKRLLKQTPLIKTRLDSKFDVYNTYAFLRDNKAGFWIFPKFAKNSYANF